jgi:hypothetical protein
MKSVAGPPMTLGAAATAGVRLIVWCRACQHQVEPTLPSTRAATAPKPAFSNGAKSWSVPGAAAATSTWSWPERGDSRAQILQALPPRPIGLALLVGRCRRLRSADPIEERQPPLPQTEPTMLRIFDRSQDAALFLLAQQPAVRPECVPAHSLPNHVLPRPCSGAHGAVEPLQAQRHDALGHRRQVPVRLAAR